MPGFNSAVNADLGPYMMAGTDPFNLTPTRQCFGTSKSLINHSFLKRSQRKRFKKGPVLHRAEPGWE